MGELGKAIVEIARKDLGQKEKKGNSGFVSAIKEAKMKLVGWIKYQSWCAYNAESYWLDAFKIHKPTHVKLLSKYFSGSVYQTWKNFRASREFKTSPNKPVLGALAIWQDGTSGLGHMGVVSIIEGVTFWSIEGNTNAQGSREGTIVGENRHSSLMPYNPEKPNGRWLMGFVYPDPIA